MCSDCSDAQGEQRSCLRAKIARWELSRINVKLSYTSDRVGHEVCLLGRRLQPIGPTSGPRASLAVGHGRFVARSRAARSRRPDGGVRQAGRDAGTRPGEAIDERARLKQVKRETSRSGLAVSLYGPRHFSQAVRARVHHDAASESPFRRAAPGTLPLNISLHRPLTSAAKSD